MKIIRDILPEVIVIKPKVFSDVRGCFFESFQLERCLELGITQPFVQDNISRSNYGVLRGLHYQLKHPQGKLITVIRGEVFDVAVDIRQGSPTFGQWSAFILDGKSYWQLYIPPGFAHGFCVLSDFADFHYKCSDYYHSEDESGIIWNDPKIAINWPKLEINMILSDKDKSYKALCETSDEFLPSIL